MEMLIVVAIIAVLIAIAIPIFTSQLEKAREATDLANVRSAYAEIMTAAATSDKNATYTVDGNPIYNTTDKVYRIVVQLGQAQNDWQTDVSGINIAGVKSSDPGWVDAPSANGTCTITYTPADASGNDALQFKWA
jgi:type IV pilus assembly protein PilA